jgi:AhpD family alkylhydroperoxidase
MTRRTQAITPDALDAEQRALHHAIVSGPRAAGPGGFAFLDEDGALTGPFGLMLLAPSLGMPLQAIGAQLRYGGGLPDAVREAVVLLVAGTWSCGFELHAHVPFARRLGLSDAQIDQLRNGAIPADLPEDVLLATSAVAELLRERTLSAETFAALRARFGEPGVVEITVLAGYYTTLAMMLNSFAVAVPE